MMFCALSKAKGMIIKMKIAVATKKITDHAAAMTVEEAYLTLQSAIANLSSSRAWLDYLDFQSKFYNYSFHSTLLILSQNSTATFVAGYRKWQLFDRFVKRGERGIRILSPILSKKKTVDPEEDPIFIKGFMLVSVFDLDQTDGSKEYLPLIITGLQFSISDENEIYDQIKSKITVPIIEVPDLSSKGSYQLSSQEIRIRTDLSTVQKIKTLIHEYAHHIHHAYHNENESYGISEVIAESSAYIVCRFLGIDTSDYSAPYIESWKDPSSNLAAIGVKVQKVSSDIICC